MNYKYKLIDKEFILSEEEHIKVNSAYKESGGKSVVHYLRGGKLMVNLNFVASINETHELTDSQIQERDKRMELPAPKSVSPEKVAEIKKLLGSFKKGIGTDDGWKTCAECNVPHLIPGEKTVCLGCLGKKINALKI